MTQHQRTIKMTEAPFAIIHSTTPSLSYATEKENEDYTDTIQDNVLEELMNVYEELSNERKRITNIMANVKKCCKKMNKKFTLQQEKINKLQQKTKSNNGLSKPFPISTTLCSFMSVPEGTQIARAEVTKYLHKYIKEKDLYDEDKKMYFKPDSSLKKLLNIDDEDEPVHIFSIQKKMNEHFQYTQ